MAELKPCPFCGGNAEIISFQTFAWCDNTYVVRCANPACEVEHKARSWDKKEAIEAWNRRVENEQRQ